MRKLLTATVFLTLCVQGLVARQSETPDSVEKRILERIRLIKRGKMHISWVNQHKNQSDFTLWFDIDRRQYRKDAIIRHSKHAQSPFRHIECSNCEKPGYEIVFNETTLANGHNVALLLQPHKPGKHVRNFDPRLIGFIPEDLPLLWHFNTESIFGKSDRSSTQIRREKYKDSNCVVLVIQTTKNATFEYWADPKKGYAVTKVAVSMVKNHTVVGGYVDSDLVYVPTGSLWFPSKCIVHSIKDGVSTEESTIQIRDMELNYAQSDHVFSLIGMNLKKGVIVNARNANGTSQVQTWDGTKLIEHKSPEYIPATPKLPKSQTWLYILTGACLSVALFALINYFRKSGSVRSEGVS